MNHGTISELRYRYGRPLKMNVENQMLTICMLYRDVLVSLRGMIYGCFDNTSYVIFENPYFLRFHVANLSYIGKKV